MHRVNKKEKRVQNIEGTTFRIGPYHPEMADRPDANIDSDVASISAMRFFQD